MSMRSRALIYVALLLGNAARAFTPVVSIPPAVWAELELSRLQRPKVGVPLLTPRGANIRPALPTVLESTKTLYFAHAPENKDACAGEELYKMSLDPKGGRDQRIRPTRWNEKSRAWEEPRSLCIERLHSTTQHIFVRHRVNGRWIFERLQEGPEGARLLSAEEDTTNSWMDSALWEYHVDLASSGKVRSLRSAEVGHFRQDSFLLDAVLRGKATDDHWALVSVSIEPKNSSRPAVGIRRFPEELEKQLLGRPLVNVHFGAQRFMYLMYNGKGPDDMGGFAVIDLVRPLEKGRFPRYASFGASQPIRGEARVWDSISGKHWAARYVDHASPTALGLLISDTTDTANENPLIAYYSPYRDNPDATFVRIQGLTPTHLQDLSGLQYYRGGFIASFRRHQTIAWFGARNPFSEERFPSRRPNLEGLSDEEHEELLREVGR